MVSIVWLDLIPGRLNTENLVECGDLVLQSRVDPEREGLRMVVYSLAV
jgi:hypothetical protein